MNDILMYLKEANEGNKKLMLDTKKSEMRTSALLSIIAVCAKNIERNEDLILIVEKDSYTKESIELTGFGQLYPMVYDSEEIVKDLYKQ